MLMTGGNTTCDERLVAFQVDQADVDATADQNIPVAALQRGAGDDGVSARKARVVDPAGDRRQPGPAILVRERDAAMHLVDVGGRMKPIGVLELPPKARREQRSDRRLARPRYAHDDHNRDSRGCSAFPRPVFHERRSASCCRGGAFPDHRKRAASRFRPRITWLSGPFAIWRQARICRGCHPGGWSGTMRR